MDDTSLITTPESAQETAQAAEFHIDSDRAAEWLLRKLATIDAEKARVTAQAAQICKDIEADAQRLLHLYPDYCRRKLAAQGNRRRSVSFLQGTVAFRTVAPSIKVADQSAALIHAQDACLPVVERRLILDAAGYRDIAAKHFKETGRLLPGIETTPEHETHRLTFGK